VSSSNRSLPLLPRRAFFGHVAGAGLALGLAACSKAPRPDAPVCTDLEGLAPADRELRLATVAYTDRSPTPARRCDRCQLYRPAASPEACGGCTLVRGPISPAGTCKSFAANEGA
jgi:hypothetical protein